MSKLGLSLSPIGARRFVNRYNPSDAAAVTYLNAVTAASGSRRPAADKAIDTAIIALKAASLWTGLNCLHLFYGGNAASHAINVRNPGTNNLTWTGPMNHDQTIGSAGDILSAYGDTGLVPNTAFANNQVTFGFFAVNGVINTLGGGFNMGALDVTGGSFGMQLRTGMTASTGALFLSTVNGTFFGSQNTNALCSGHYTGSQTAAAVGAVYRNGVQIGSNNTGSANGSRPTNNIFYFADSKGAGVENQGIGGAWVGLAYVYTGGLTSGQVTTLNGIIQTLMTNMGRPVGTVPTSKNVTVLGDSLTSGSNASTLLTTYPAVLKTLGNYGIRNGGVPGIQISGAGTVGKDMLTDYANVPTSFFITGTKNIYVIWAGTNDIANQANTAGIGTTTYNNLVSYVQAIKTANPTSKVVVCTCIDRKGGITGTQGNFNAARAVYNAAILADTTNFDAKVDLAGMSQFSDATNATYFEQANKTHLTDAGYAIVANSINTPVAAF